MSELDNFETLLSDHWDFVMEQNPMFATRTGNHRFNDQLGEVSEKNHDKELEKFRNFQIRMMTIDSSQFSKQDKLNYEIFSLTLKNFVERKEFKAYRLSLSKLSGFHQFLPMIALIVPLNGLDDYNNYIARLHAVPALADGNIELLENGLKDGQILPKIALEGIVKTVTDQIVDDASKTQFYHPFLKFPNTIEESDHEALREEGLKAIQNSIFPALKKFGEFLENEYLPNSRETIAAIDLPDGENYYQHCISFFTSLDLTAQQIHDIGVKEVNRILLEMEEVKEDAGFKGSLDKFKEFLRTDSKFYPETAEELMEKTAFVLKKIDGKLPEIFKTLPRLPYGIRRIPDHQAPGSTTAYYMRGTGDGTRSGTYYVNTYDLKSRPLFEIEALSLHEAVPGHHLQLSLQMELELPNFRKHTGITAFVEGWGLYSERLGLETGFYTDPYSNFGRLSYEMWRATRLVVDTGMHALGWSRQKAIDFMMKNTSLTLLNVTNEIDRYIVWPGQALAYKMGELKIRELRKMAEERLGIRFNLRDFHDEILINGALPLNILEDHINDWIAGN